MSVLLTIGKIFFTQNKNRKLNYVLYMLCALSF